MKTCILAMFSVLTGVIVAQENHDATLVCKVHIKMDDTINLRLHLREVRVYDLCNDNRALNKKSIQSSTVLSNMAASMATDGS